MKVKKFGEFLNESVNEGKKAKIIVWTDDNKKKKTIDLDPGQLEKTVSSGHDNDWNWNIDRIKQHIDHGDKKGTTDITRYHGGGSDTVYWELKESLNEAKLPIDKSWRFGGNIIQFFDSIPALKKYRDPHATYDDAHFTIPIKDFKKIVGWTEKEVKEINDRLEQYEGYIMWGKNNISVGDGA